MALNVKASLLRKCHAMTIRTDVCDARVYICTYWIIKLLEDLEKEHDREHTSINDDFIPFLAVNQFKKKLAKYIIKPKNDTKLGQKSSS